MEDLNFRKGDAKTDVFGSSSGAAHHLLPLLSLCDIFPRPGEICPDQGKAYAPARFQEIGTALTSKKDCCTRCRAAVLRIVIKRI